MPDPQEIMPRGAEGALVEPYPLLQPQIANNVIQLFDDSAGANFSIFNFPRILVASGGGLGLRLQSLNGEEMEKEVEGVIIAFRQARVYWRESYGGGGGAGKPPDCSSKDGLVGIGDPGGSCVECPNARFGSALQQNGQPGSGQACKEIRQMLVLRPDEILPHLFNVPPTSLKNFVQYTMGLFSKRIPYWALVSRLSLERATNETGMPYSKIVFKAGRRFTKEEAAVLAPYHEKMKELLTPATLESTDYTVYEAESDAPGRR